MSSNEVYRKVYFSDFKERGLQSVCKKSKGFSNNFVFPSPEIFKLWFN